MTEFVSRLYLATREAGQKLDVRVTETISYNNSSKPGPEKTLRFKTNPSGVAGSIYSKGVVLYA